MTSGRPAWPPKYREARNRSYLIARAADDNTLLLHLTCATDAEFYDHPLTFEIDLPPGAGTPAVLDGSGNTVEAAIEKNGSASVVRFNVRPVDAVYTLRAETLGAAHLKTNGPELPEPGPHPYLFFTEDDLPALKEKTGKSPAKEMWQQVASEHREGLRLYWSGTHPFSTWRDQQITPDKRYQGMVNLLQDTARQLVTFGLHVHVGVDSGDKAVMICERILRHLPLLLALSCNSPFWEGRVTGLNSWRSKVMEGLPTAGLPPLMRNWSEYVWLVNHLVETGYIESIREIWWDVRPHNTFGTVEVRICDIPGCFEDTLGLVALIQCLIKCLSDQIDHGAYQHDCHPMLIRQNKWRAAR